MFDMKKVVFQPIPFYVGSYMFSKVKSAPDFVKDLEKFHFDEKSFHRNDSQGKVVAHHALLKVNFEYADYLDKYEEVHQNVCNMTTLKKLRRRKTTMLGGKGSSNSKPEHKGKEEEAARKGEEDEAGKREKEEIT